MVSRPQAEAMAVAPNPTFEGGPFPRPSRARSFLLRHPALNLCLSAVLWLVLLCAFCAFVVITLGRPTAFWDLPSHKVRAGTRACVCMAMAACGLLPLDCAGICAHAHAHTIVTTIRLPARS